MTSTRGGLVVWMLATLLAVGCDEIEGGRKPLTVAASGSSVVAQRPATSDAGAAEVVSPGAGVTADAAAPTPVPGSYEAMCHHYCEALEQTNVYACLSRGGGDLGSCTAAVADLPDRCDQLRCAPKLVEPQLCFTQCDSLAAVYGPYCATAAATPACTATPLAHDEVCRAGCASVSP